MENRDVDRLLASIFALQKKGRIYVISGPSGSGKTVACQAVMKRIPAMTYSISYTTRNKRPQEVDGRDYFFVSDEEFQTLVREGKFLEWAQVHGKWYGTSQEKIYKEIDSGNNVILDIDIQGAEQIRKKEKRCSSVFLLPPSMEVLYSRLVKRKSDSSVEISNRIDVAYHEIEHYHRYDYVIVNDKFDDLVEQLEGIIRVEAHRIA
jgi:guanylate kinase